MIYGVPIASFTTRLQSEWRKP